MAEPDWLIWSRELQSIAQAGLTFCENGYDRERYEQIRAMGVKLLAAHTAAPEQKIAALLAGETGYATPKVDVRGAAFDGQGRILMVRETSDAGRWTLPGGWADVNLSPAENVVKEMREESGFATRVVKLAACWDRTRQGHTHALFSCVKLFFLCEITGGSAATGLETSEVGWFAEDALPAELSTGRVLKPQLLRMFAHRREPGLATEYE